MFILGGRTNNSTTKRITRGQKDSVVANDDTNNEGIKRSNI